MTPNLETNYLGMTLAHPVVASPGPWTHDLDGFRRLEDGGVSAIVMHSLFEEQVTAESHLIDHYLDYGAESYGESLSYLPEWDDFRTGPDDHFELLSRAREAVAIPIVGSLNGATPGGWSDYARRMEQAGASALELNLYHLPTDPEESAATVEKRYLDVVQEVRAQTRLPMAVKIGPFFTAPAHMAKSFAEAGADALVLFNRFYQPDLDLEDFAVVPRLELSSRFENRLPLRWVAILFGRVPVEFAITGGVQESEDVVKGIMAGANVVMMTSELLRGGISRTDFVVEGLREWLEENGYESVSEMRGSMSQCYVENPEAFERANYIRTLQSWRPDPALGHD